MSLGVLRSPERECSGRYDDLVPVAPSFAFDLHAKQDCGLIILSDGAYDQSNQIFLPIVCPTLLFPASPQDIGKSVLGTDTADHVLLLVASPITVLCNESC